MRPAPAAGAQGIDRERTRENERRKGRWPPAARREQRVPAERDDRVRERGDGRRPESGRCRDRETEHQGDQRRDEQRIEEGFPRDGGDVVEVQREDRDRAEIPERRQAKDLAHRLADGKHAAAVRRHPSDETDRSAENAGEMRGTPDVHVAPVERMPQVVERPSQDRDERADTDEGETELRPDRADRKRSAADRTAAHRGHGGDERGDAPERHPRVDEQVRGRPKRIPAVDPVPGHIPARSEPAEERADRSDDERRPQRSDPSGASTKRERDGRHRGSILGTDLQQLDAGAVLIDGERGHEHSPARPAFASEREPPGTEAGQAFELASIDGFGRGHERARAPRLDLDEDIAVAIPTDEVDLAGPRAGVPREDPITASLQLDLGRSFAGHPEDRARVHGTKSGARLRYGVGVTRMMRSVPLSVLRYSEPSGAWTAARRRP